MELTHSVIYHIWRVKLSHSYKCNSRSKFRHHYREANDLLSYVSSSSNQPEHLKIAKARHAVVFHRRCFYKKNSSPHPLSGQSDFRYDYQLVMNLLFVQKCGIYNYLDYIWSFTGHLSVLLQDATLHVLWKWFQG